MKLYIKHLRTVLLRTNQEGVCPILTGSGDGVQYFRSDGEGEETSGLREHGPPQSHWGFAAEWESGAGVG